MSTNWNPVEKTYARTTIPLDREVLVIYRGRIGLCEWSDEERCFWIAWTPVEFDAMRVCAENEHKISFWMDIPPIHK